MADVKLRHVPKLVDPMLQTFLAGRDVGCPVCEYNLRDLQTDLCPECGTWICLQVRPVEPRQAACIAGLIGLAAGAGFSGLLVVYIGVRIIIDSFSSPPERFVLVTVIPLIIQSALLIVWLRKWRQIRRLPRRSSGLLVIGCWAVSLSNVVFFAVNVR